MNEHTKLLKQRDTTYGELHAMAPGLFPESIAHPADQLLHMYEVGKSITKSEKSMKDYQARMHRPSVSGRRMTLMRLWETL